MNAKVYSREGKETGKVELPEAVFGVAWNPDLVHEVVIGMQANARNSTAHTKDRSEVRGGGRKPWKQKGTGRARAGSNRSPLWKGGGTTFGPQPRDYSYRMPRKKVRAALRVALSDALRDGRLTCVDDLTIDSPKTKAFATAIAGLGDLKGALFVVDQLTDNLALASRNINTLAVAEANDITPYDVVACRRLVVSKAAMAQLGGPTDAA
jgi:large subunit ribosomal protein L4